MSSIEQFRAAAQARKGAVDQNVHRPRKRAGRPTVHATVRAVTTPDGINFTGLASAYERGYEMYDVFGPYTEIVSYGAGMKSLGQSGLDVTLNLGHDQLRRIARTTNGTLTLRETSAGLEVEAPNLNPDDADVQYILPKLNGGLIDEMSFAFRIVSGKWSPDYTEYRIDEYDLHRGDVAIVGYGANPNTSAATRSQPAFAPITEDETRMLSYYL